MGNLHKNKVGKKNSKLDFDKYDLYRRSVQSPETDAEFLRNTYVELKKKQPKIFREDFCGTFLLSTEWIKLGPKFEAFGIDLDPEPISYGKKYYLPKLKPDQQKRMHVLEMNVLESGIPNADLVAAMNFSYFIFKTREAMKKYFTNVFRSLKKDGVFILDLFGGSLCYDQNEEMTAYKDFNYYWDQKNFDPVSAHAIFQIHFKLKGHAKHENVFNYDWRMWTIPELREILAECGFKKSHVYWEGTTKNGRGDGIFTRTEKGEACQSWIAYLAAEK